MDFYSFDDIRAAGSCIDYASQVLRLPIQGDRCQATWRGGDGFNVALSTSEWYDHKARAGGGLLDLCATAKYGGDIMQAQEELGRWLGLKVKTSTVFVAPGEGERKTKYEELRMAGYERVCQYDYRGLDGAIVHSVVRLRHPETGKKEFLQRTPSGWGLRDVTPILYRMSDWADSSWVCVVEGEKDADSLAALGIPATTNSGGAEKWRPEFSAAFAGKDIVILPDNDDAGRFHARTVARALLPVAVSLRVVSLSKLPKGDVTDWLEQEGGNADALTQALAAADPVDPEEFTGTDEEWAVTQAKKANEKPFYSFHSRKVELPGGAIKWEKVPRSMNQLLADKDKRFLRFPRRVGDSQLFDHDRETGRIEFLHKTSSLFSWMQLKSGHPVYWTSGEGFPSKEEFFEGVMASAQRYEAVSPVPSWPRRADVYYAHQPLPPPTGNHFEKLVGFFNPASEAYRHLMKAFFLAPLYYEDSVARPAWVIDSDSGAGVGKTTLVEMVSLLYGGNPIRTSKQELKQDCKELIKRLVSSEGRSAKIVLVDNVTGAFSSQEFADLVTARSISGKAPYGRGEEVRPNNLTWAITANSANLDNDISSRSFFLMVRRPASSWSWKRDVLSYINENRLAIFSDMLAMVQAHRPFDGIAPVSRFPEFETCILQPACGGIGEYSDVCRVIYEAREEANIEEDQAKQIEEALRFAIVDLRIHPDRQRVFIRNDALAKILEHQVRNASAQDVRNLAKNGLLRRLDPAINRYPTTHELRRYGVMWVPDEPDDTTNVHIIGVGREGKTEVSLVWNSRAKNGDVRSVSDNADDAF